MAWIELHQTLPRHPKLLRLAGRLRIHPAQAAGHLTFLWLWTLDYAPTGDLSAFGPAEISAAACFPGDAEQFHRTLMETGWLDEDGQVHDWHEYAGRLVEERAKDKERKRAARANAVQKASAGRPSDSGRTAAVPNPTQPNPTEETHTQRPPAREDSSTWPTLTEVKALAAMQGIPPTVAEAFWSHFEAQGWQTKDGLPIVRWQPKLTSWWVNEQARTAKDAARPPQAPGRTIGTSTPDDAKF